MKELPTYRIELEEILKAFPDRRILTIKDIMGYTGRSRRFIAENLNITGTITAQALAYKLAELNHRNMQAK